MREAKKSSMINNSIEASVVLKESNRSCAAVSNVNMEVLLQCQHCPKDCLERDGTNGKLSWEGMIIEGTATKQGLRVGVEIAEQDDDVDEDV
ncbi:hypothetical protein HPP92_009285 [Vanilla planifolia]|uniref:Uncharacterized protein n=1 Tax=Vanilla planifolia TaxID=51239 RepID=A0A835R7Y4_VANPL|nr:hypothetical protein HPP92_009493 [Vanilla planifolia]KAG0487190.1 hypothetical protein HPP92_009285 [Vanilla planifolia]